MNIEELTRLNTEAIANGVLRKVLIDLKETQPLQAHDYMIIEDEDYKGSVLDVGCGPGVTSIVSALKNDNLDITIMDGSQVNMEIASTLATKAGLTPDDIKLRIGLVGDIIKEKYDTVVMSHVLEHLQDVQFAISWLKSITNPGGTIFIAVPYKDCHYDPGHLHFFRITDDTREGMYSKDCNTFDIERLLKNMNIKAEISVFDMEKVDERQPYPTKGQLDMLIKIKVKK